MRNELKKTQTPAQRKSIREKIIRIRVLKGGRRYIKNCNKRITKYQNEYKKNKSAVNKRKLEICIRRYYKAKKIYMKRSIKQERNRFFKKVIVKKIYTPGEDRLKIIYRDAPKTKTVIPAVKKPIIIKNRKIIRKTVTPKKIVKAKAVIKQTKK